MIVEEVQKVTLHLPDDKDYYEGFKNNKDYVQVSEIHNKYEHTVVFEKHVTTVTANVPRMEPISVSFNKGITQPLGFTDEEVDMICRN